MVTFVVIADMQRIMTENNILFILALVLVLMVTEQSLFAADSSGKRARELGIEVGVLQPGKWNAITDVSGVRVGHTTLIAGDSVRTGVTAILPHDGNLYQKKAPAAIYVGNGFGKLVGFTQIEELGNIETPILLTNTLNVPRVADALMSYMLQLEGNNEIRSLNPVVGETNDGWLNDIRGRHVTSEHVVSAIEQAQSGAVAEGCVGAGTGTTCLGFKGGIGTSSRRLPDTLGGFTVGVLVQTNYGGILEINGAPVGRELQNYAYRNEISYADGDGSCLIVVATDAPLLARNLKRLARRAYLALGKTGSFSSNGSGDYVIAFSNHDANLTLQESAGRTQKKTVLSNQSLSPLFLGVVEATQEAVYNSMFMATDMTGRDGHTVSALPTDKVIDICKKYNVLNWNTSLPNKATHD